uniref:YceD family protein n=1 Tax=Turicimonas muris TaxID=1796652 RepID=UPI00402AC4C5
MTELLKSTDYVDVYRMSRDKRKIEGKVKVGDMKRLAETASNHDDIFDYVITGMTGKLGWPGAIMELHGKVAVPCNRCNNPVDVPIDREVVFRFAKSEEEADTIPIEEDDDTEVVVGSEKLNVMDWIEEEIILSIPLVPSHDYACLDKEKLNKDDEPLEKENPFAKLKGMKFNK